MIAEHDEKLLRLKLGRKGWYSPRVGLACLFLNLGSSKGKYLKASLASANSPSLAWIFAWRR